MTEYEKRHLELLERIADSLELSCANLENIESTIEDLSEDINKCTGTNLRGYSFIRVLNME